MINEIGIFFLAWLLNHKIEYFQVYKKYERDLDLIRTWDYLTIKERFILLPFRKRFLKKLSDKHFDENFYPFLPGIKQKDT